MVKTLAQPSGFCLGTLCCPFVQYLLSLAFSAFRVITTEFSLMKFFNLSMRKVFRGSCLLSPGDTIQTVL